jgi:hypothetical protein
MNRRIWSTEPKTAIVLGMVKGGELTATTHIP